MPIFASNHNSPHNLEYSTLPTHVCYSTMHALIPCFVFYRLSFLPHLFSYPDCSPTMLASLPCLLPFHACSSTMIDLLPFSFSFFHHDCSPTMLALIKCLLSYHAHSSTMIALLPSLLPYHVCSSTILAPIPCLLSYHACSSTIPYYAWFPTTHAALLPCCFHTTFNIFIPAFCNTYAKLNWN